MKGYTNKEEIENFMLIEIDDSFDSQIERWIEVAEDMIDDITGRDFGVVLDDDEDPGEPTDRVFDGDCTSTLYVGSFTGEYTVKLDPDSDTIDEDQVLAYPANKATKNKLVLRYLTFPEGKQNIVVNALWGNDGMDPTIRQVATFLVAAMIDVAFSEGSKVSSLTIGRYSVTYKSAKLEEPLMRVEAMLDLKRRMTF